MESTTKRLAKVLALNLIRSRKDGAVDQERKDRKLAQARKGRHLASKDQP